MILPCDCPSPAHCLEATGGEQGETAEMLEIARLRRERIEQEAMNLEIAGDLEKAERERDEARAERDELETRWGAEVVHANNWCARARAAEHERDEARAKLEEAKRAAYVGWFEICTYRFWGFDPGVDHIEALNRHGSDRIGKLGEGRS